METIDKYDALVLGGGIAGMEAALDLAEQGYQVALVEAGPSIGGKMIQLAKVFPTLDCASCITTPKMAQVAHHPSVGLFTLSQMKGISGQDGDFKVSVHQKPRYVDLKKCIGCMQCEQACPVMAPSAEQGGFSARKAIYMPFAAAIPQAPVMEVEHCIACGRCARICPTAAVDYFQQARDIEFQVKAVVLCTGYKLYQDYATKAYGEFGRQPNLVDALQMERLLAPTSPYGHLLRPSDGKQPESVAFIQCAGSRDVQLGVPHCSRVCCMYNIKQAILIRREYPETKCTIFCMDVRCYGKGYEQFYTTAREVGVEFVNAKAIVTGQEPDGGVRLHFDNTEVLGTPQTRIYDLAVLSLAIVPGWQPDGSMKIQMAQDDFIATPHPHLSPTLTNRPGIFVAGVATGPKDIVDTVIEAGSAASEAGIFLRELKSSRRQAA